MPSGAIRFLSFILLAQFVLVKCLSKTPVVATQKHIKTETFTDIQTQDDIADLMYKDKVDTTNRYETFKYCIFLKLVRC